MTDAAFPTYPRSVLIEHVRLMKLQGWWPAFAYWVRYGKPGPRP